MDDESEGSEGGGILKKILLFLLLLIIGAVGAYFFLFPQEEEEKPEIIREGPPPLENPQYLDIGTFIVNLQGGKYYLKASLQLAFDDPLPKMWLTSRLPIIKDLIIAELRTLTPKQIKDPKVRYLLKTDLKTKLNSLFPNDPSWEDPEPIKKILFAEFYRQ